MSFSDFSCYAFRFDRLDSRLESPDMQNKYYNRWMRKYAGIFRRENKTLIAIEWDLRCRKAMCEIFSSATFFVEAKKNLEMKCFCSYYFCLYYSLFHAIYSCVFLDADSSTKKLLSVTHRNIINIFISAFGNSKKDILTREIQTLFVDLKYRREYYSYVTPFNNLFACEEDLEKLRKILLDCYQLTSFHSLMTEKSYCKNIGGIVNLANSDEVSEFDELFRKLFSKECKNGRNMLDPSCVNLRGELLKQGIKPEYIALDLDHQFDEFHTYDRFGYSNSNKDALNVMDIWSFVAEALM